MSSDTAPNKNVDPSMIPANIGRNDPCVCGSGKKYKKCCMRIHQALSESSKKTRSVTQLITGATLPYDVYKVLRDIHENNLLALFFDAGHELGPWRTGFASKDAFLLDASAGKTTLPAGAAFEFQRMRIDEPDVHILLAAHADDPRRDHVEYQVLTLRRNEFDADRSARQTAAPGWRLWDLSTHKIAKGDLDDGEGANVHLDRFDVRWHPRDRRAPPTHVRAEEEE